MGTFSIWHWLIVLVVVLVLFGGGGKLSKLMGDAGKGINSFKKGLKEQQDEKVEADGQAEDGAQRSIEPETAERKDKTAASG